MVRCNPKFWQQGEHWIWLNAGGVALCVILVVGLLLLITVRGLQHFWPNQVTMFELYPDGDKPTQILGEMHDKEQPAHAELPNYLIKIGNRDHYGSDFIWLDGTTIKAQSKPQEVVAIERREWGLLLGYLIAVHEGEHTWTNSDGDAFWQAADRVIYQGREHVREMQRVQKNEIGRINYALEQLRLRQRKYELHTQASETQKADMSAEQAELQQRYATLQQSLQTLQQNSPQNSLELKLADGTLTKVSVDTLIRLYRPNAMTAFDKVKFYGMKVWEFLAEDPREANTEGGIFPAIFGTIMMVFLMSIIVTPFGVITAVYLKEYAKQGWIIRLLRVAVNNLAGVPSVVYGVFGLGFFVYFVGGNLDKLFYPEALPAPTFGTPGLLWASVTLALLTLPVVIVATEEGLSRVPKSVREGSLALGATKAETLWRIVLPMASPAMMTGLILAIARAAGEVAPLMLVGVVKLAPTLPLDMNMPFLHLERKFMHLGFHIYDVGFQSPNVEAARPLVYATTMLLVLIIILLNIVAIRMRNRLRERYKALEH